MKKIAIVGLWHQGIVAAGCMAQLGYSVVAADRDEERISSLSKGKAPLYEPGLDDLLAKGLESGDLRFTSDIGESVNGARYVLLMFDTRVDEDDKSDLSDLFDAVDVIADHLENDAVLLVTAQVPVGSCDRIAQAIRLRKPDAVFGVAYVPENLRLGEAIERFRKPALPVVGADDERTLDRIEELFEPLGAEWRRVSLRTAEMVKHSLNAYLAVSVCFGNEIGNLCDEIGADAGDIAKVLRIEPRVGDKAMLMPGLGFAGGTLARDMQTLRGLGDECGIETALLDGAWEANLKQNGLVLRKLTKALGCLDGKRVAVLGLTYKPGTSTLRRSASLEVIRTVVAAGASVAAHDPRADREELKACSDLEFFEGPKDAAKGADALVLMTPWQEYRELDFGEIQKAMAREPVVLDTDGMWDGDELVGLGFTYLDIGRGRMAGGE